MSSIERCNNNKTAGHVLAPYACRSVGDENDGALLVVLEGFELLVVVVQE